MPMRLTLQSLRLPLAVLGALWALPLGLAAAQNNPLGLWVTSLEGTGDDTCTTRECVRRGFGATACAMPENAAAVIRPMDTTTMIPAEFVDLWVATGSADCSTVMERNPDMGTCTHLGTADLDPTSSSFSVTLSQMAAAADEVCSDTAPRSGTNVNLFALATGSTMETGEVGDAFGRVTVLVDSRGPVAPTLDQATASGDTEVDIGWDMVGDDNATYRIYAGAVHEDSSCGGLVADDGGVTADPGELTFVKETGTSAASTTIDPEEDLGLEIGQSIEVYVRAVDQARNEGDLAGPICVSRVELVGFCDSFGECDSEGCTAAGGPIPKGFGLALVGALVLLRRRRR